MAFETNSDAVSEVSLYSFEALRGHGESLVELKLPDSPPQACRFAPKLKGCTNLISLLFGNPHYSEFPCVYNDVAFCETTNWLKECKKLQTLTFRNFPRASASLDSILSDGIQLKALEFVDDGGYESAKIFLPTLENQTSLQSLYLKGMDPENIDPEDANAVVKLLSKLVNLTDLRVECLFGLDDLQLKQLASNLPLLEVWFTSESELTGKVWGAVASVSSLRKEETGGLTVFKTRRTLGLTE